MIHIDQNKIETDRQTDRQTNIQLHIHIYNRKYGGNQKQ